MIHVIPHVASEGLRKENAAHAGAVASYGPQAVREMHPTAQAYADAFLATVEGKQFAQAIQRVPPGKKVLDIGAGYGRSTIFLASRGYQVVAVEPAPALCDFIDRLGKSYGLDIAICNAPAEAIDRLPTRKFDACVFSASLHHCDDPVRALSNCHEVLLQGGIIFLLNEPQLHFFRSKRWFRRQLEQGTLVTGDYGGNEHIYYHHEYHDMLRQAGFVRIRDALSNRYREPAGYLGYLKSQGNGLRTILARRVYYRLISTLERGSIVGRGVLSVLKRLSLVQTYFVARRP
jgi:SAM-dependent methyltransferase